MSRPTERIARLSLVSFLLFTAACNSLFKSSPTGRPVPTLRPLSSGPTSTPMMLGPSGAGWIAFIKNSNVWLIHPDGSGMKQVSRNQAPVNPSAPVRARWSTDGQKLAFSYDGHLDVLDLGSLAVIRLVDDTAGGFDWSPGGYQLVYDTALTVGQQRAYDYSNSGLSVVDVRSGNQRNIVPSSTRYPAMVNPLWSLDTSRVIFSDPTGAEPGGLHLVDILTGKITDLLPPGPDQGSCSWAPTSLTIVCLKPSSSTLQEWVIALLDGNGNEKRKIPVPAEYHHPQLGPWLSDGSKLALQYTSDPDGTQEMISILALDSGEFKPLGPGRASDWSPDGRWILMASSTPGAAQPGPMTVINTTSAQVVPLADGFSPLWQPGDLFAVWRPSQALNEVPTAPAFCIDSMVLFVHLTKGYYFQVCSGSQHYSLGPLETGVYSMGPGGNWFLYASNSGYIYVARVGDRRLTQIGNIRNFIIIRKRGDPLYQFRFLGEGPDSVKVTELSFHEDVTFIIPRRITAP